MLQKKSKWESLKKIAANIEETDRVLLLDLVKILEKKKRIPEEEAEEYVDFLLGVADQAEPEEQEVLYRVIEQLQE